MRVKICGITNLEDALDAINAGADALGFVFYEKSPRYISPQNAKAIVDKLPPFIERVGLFVQHTSQEVNEICMQSNMSLAQIHFEPEDDFFAELTIKHIKVVRAQSQEDLEKYSNEYRLVDAFVESFGGEGKRIEPSWFQDIDCSKIILAGGLDAKNVAQMRNFGFFGVDVSSGVEKTKGKKDKMKIYHFIKEAKYGNV